MVGLIKPREEAAQAVVTALTKWGFVDEDWSTNVSDALAIHLRKSPEDVTVMEILNFLLRGFTASLRP